MELGGVPHELMTDILGTPFVAIARTILSRFQPSLDELPIHHIRTQIDTSWTNGKIEAFWHTLQAEVLDRQQLADLAAAAETAVTAYAGTSTTTGSTASWTGRHRPSGSTPTAASGACRCHHRRCFLSFRRDPGGLSQSPLHRGTSVSGGPTRKTGRRYPATRCARPPVRCPARCLDRAPSPAPWE